jgi:NADPH2:quinone reductase
MRAIVVAEHGGPEVLRLEEVAEPSPGPGQVSIDVAYAGVNFAEVMGRRGTLPIARAPFVPGLEVSGTVRAVGAGVDGLRVGERVAALTTEGGYAEVAVAPAAVTFGLAGGDLRAAAAFPVVVPTAWALIHEVARVRAGETVLIHAAAGGVGIVAGQIARAAGAGRVLGVTSTREKAAYALRFGYDAVFVGSDEAPGGLDVILDSIGGATRQRSLELLAPLGRLAIYGNASGEPEAAVPAARLRREAKAVLGFSIATLAAADPARAQALGRQAMRAGIEVDITDVLPLEDAGRAHERLESRRSTGKLLLAVAGDA